MASVLNETTTRKPRTSYYAHYYDEAGFLTKVAGSLYFVSQDGAVIEEVPLDSLSFLTVLGQVQLAEAQHLEDLMQGGPAGVACGRQMEV